MAVSVDEVFDRIVEELRRHYPEFFPAHGTPVGGDFEREALKEAAGTGKERR